MDMSTTLNDIYNINAGIEFDVGTAKIVNDYFGNMLNTTNSTV
jgi:hypothetical protein